MTRLFKKIESAHQSVIFDIFVFLDVVQDSDSQSGRFVLPLGQVLNCSRQHLLYPEVLDVIRTIHAVTGLCVLPALNLVSSLAVVAQQSQADGKDGNGVFRESVPGGRGLSVKPGSPFLVADSRSSKGDKFNGLEDLGLSDVDVTENGEGTTETYSGNDEAVSVGKISEAGDSLIPDATPHVVHFRLNFTAFTSVFVLMLNDEKSTWIAQRISCSMFLILAVYLNANTEYSEQTERIALVSTIFSSMMVLEMGLLLASHPTQLQTMGSSSLPTSRLFTRAIWSWKGIDRQDSTKSAKMIVTEALMK